MNQTLLAILKQLIAEYGEDILSDPKRLKPLFSDYAKSESREDRVAFGRCMETGSYQELKKTRTVEERQRVKASLADQMHGSTGIDKQQCASALDLLEAVVFGEVSRQMPGQMPGTPGRETKNLCKNCGKELPGDWKACPFCGAVVGTGSAEKTAPAGTPKEAANLTQSANPIKEKDGFVFIPGGSFLMGSPKKRHDDDDYDDEVPQHQVTLSSFWMGKYPVTQKEYTEITGNNPSKFKGDNLPVVNVSWYDTIKFCNSRSLKEGLTPAYTIKGLTGKDVSWDWNANGYRLPTEAEWEYAARGGDGSPGNYTYSGSNNTDEVAWHAGNSGNRMQSVGTKKSNGLELYDMTGNVSEWCWDRYSGYSSGSQTDPTGSPYGDNRIYRGGSYLDDAWSVISRGNMVPANRILWLALGLRLVRKG
jgi:formylglycine-generating enzyme required for sulfatase activity